MEPHGVDLVVEVGGVGTLNESIRAIRIGGTIAFIGVLPAPAVRTSASADGDATATPARRHGRSVEDLQALVDAITVNRMKPVIDKTFSSSGQGGLYLHGERSAFWESGDRDRVTRWFGLANRCLALIFDSVVIAAAQHRAVPTPVESSRWARGNRSAGQY